MVQTKHLKVKENVMRGMNKLLGGVVACSLVVSSLIPSSSAFAALTADSTSVKAKHIATYVGEVPEIDGVTWADGVTKDTFATAFSEVSIMDTDGSTYRVEVIPEGTVYFIDAVNGSSETSEPYAAVKDLVGDSLLNTVNEQLKTDENSWGLVAASLNAKGTNDTTVTQKQMSGIYGANTKGNTLSYAVTLEPGQYTLYSDHYEWWNSRTTNTSLTIGSETYDTGSVTVSSNSESMNTYSFEVDEKGLVTYTMTAAANNAPIVSWFAVVKTGEVSNNGSSDDEDDDSATDSDSTKDAADTIDATSAKAEIEAANISGNYEDEGKLTTVAGDLSNDYYLDKVFKQTVQWNNSSNYYIEATDASLMSGEFTLLFDIDQSAPTDDTAVLDNRIACTIGNSTNAIQVLSYSGYLGYGTSKNGLASNKIALTGVNKDSLNCIAVTYKEENGANGSVKVYINGVLAGEVADIGFKLSEQTDTVARFARNYGTNYLQQGTYDAIRTSSVALSENAAIYITKSSYTTKSALDYTNVPTDIITIDGADVEEAANNVNGLTYKGFGVLNGNSTSNLLMDYKSESEEEYWEMMEFLFGGDYPLFSHIKMEMGNDGNNSTGADACTMRYEDEEADASRSPGFAMAADAKTINPDVKISMLRWGMPNWVSSYWSSDRTGAGYEAMYKWYSETIFDAYEKYGYVVDFIDPDTNETSNPDEDFIKWFADRIETEDDFPDYFTEDAIEAYHNIKIIASDENKSNYILSSMQSDSTLLSDVDIVGYHYRTDTDYYSFVKSLVEDYDKEIWYSEGCATFGYTELQENKTSTYGYESIGGYQSPLALMDSIIVAFDGSYRTHYVFQPAIGAFYEGVQYGHKELLSARDPWSGYIHYDPALYMLEHFTAFANTGWENEDNTAGIYRVIANATDGAFSASTSEHNSAGIDGNASYMTLAAPDGSNFSTVFVNNTENAKKFYIKLNDMDNLSSSSLRLWVTETDNYLQDKGLITANEYGYYEVTIPAYSIATATTLVDVKPNKLDSEDEDLHIEDRTVLDTDSTGKNEDTTDDYLYADDFEYEEEEDVAISYAGEADSYTVSYLESRGNEPRYMVDSHGAFVVEDGKLVQELSASVSQWNSGDPVTLLGDYRWMNYTTSLDITLANNTSSTWAGLGVRSQTGMNWNADGYTLRVYGNGKYEVYEGSTVLTSGYVTVAGNNTYNVTITAVDSNVIFKLAGKTVYSYQDSTPYDAGRIKISSSWTKNSFDNLIVKTIDGTIPYITSMIDGQDDLVTYDSAWTINNPGSGDANNWYRTVSYNNSTNATVEFTFPVEGTGFSIIGKNSAGVGLDVYVDGSLVEKATTISSASRYASYTLSGLTMDKHTVKLVVTSGTLNIDAFYTLGQVKGEAATSIKSVDTSSVDVDYVLIDKDGKVAKMPTLPSTLTATYTDGTTGEVAVSWEADEDATAYGDISLVATVDKSFGLNIAGEEVSASVTATALPVGTVYFVDVVEAKNKLETTEGFSLVSEAIGDSLLNTVADQLKTEDNTWGLVDTDAGTKGYSSTADKWNTGIYGANNAYGETLTYEFYLEPGTYRIYSAHHEWWSMTRPMTATLVVGDDSFDAGTISLSGSSGDILNTYEFEVSEAGTVSYTLTATGTQAPVVSWLAIEDLSVEIEADDNTDDDNTSATEDSSNSNTSAADSNSSSSTNNGTTGSSSTSSSTQSTSSSGSSATATTSTSSSVAAVSTTDESTDTTNDTASNAPAGTFVAAVGEEEAEADVEADNEQDDTITDTAIDTTEVDDEEVPTTAEDTDAVGETKGVPTFLVVLLIIAVSAVIVSVLYFKKKQDFED